MKVSPILVPLPYFEPLTRIYLDPNQLNCWHRFQVEMGKALGSKLSVRTQFFVGCETYKLVAGKENVLSPIETKTEQHMHIYL